MAWSGTRCKVSSWTLLLDMVGTLEGPPPGELASCCWETFGNPLAAAAQDSSVDNDAISTSSWCSFVSENRCGCICRPLLPPLCELRCRRKL